MVGSLAKHQNISAFESLAELGPGATAVPGNKGAPELFVVQDAGKNQGGVRAIHQQRGHLAMSEPAV